MSGKGRPRTRIKITNPALFASVIRRVIDGRFAGIVSAMAEEIGVDRALLSRVLSGKAASLDPATIKKLRTALSQADFLEVDRALVSGEAGELLRAFDAWIAAEFTRLLYREKPVDTTVGRAVRSLPGWEFQRRGEFEHLIEILGKRFPKLFDSFDDFLERRMHYRARAELAYVRILAPLLDARESGHVERRWEEMTDSELRAFIKAGMARERIMLDRQPDVQRVQDAAAVDPVHLLALYNATWDDRAMMGNTLLARYRRLRHEQVEGLRSAGG